MKSLIIPCVVLLLSGCGAKGPTKYEVTGTVTYEGQPLERGSIAVVPINTKLRPDEKPIKDGKYTILAPEGEAEVRIYATRVTGPFNKEMGAAPEANYLHDNYHAYSKLRLTVRSSDKNVYDFHLNKSGT